MKKINTFRIHGIFHTKSKSHPFQVAMNLETQHSDKPFSWVRSLSSKNSLRMSFHSLTLKTCISFTTFSLIYSVAFTKEFCFKTRCWAPQQRIWQCGSLLLNYYLFSFQSHHEKSGQYNYQATITRYEYRAESKEAHVPSCFLTPLGALYKQSSKEKTIALVGSRVTKMA